MDVEDAYLKTRVPNVVMYHRSFQCCEADNCQYWWTPDEMEAPHNMLFQMKSYRWGWDAKNSRCYRQNFLSNAYLCIHHMSCLEQARRNVQKNFYMGDYYFQDLTQEHVKLLQHYGYWEHILKSHKTSLTMQTLNEAKLVKWST